MNQFKVFAINPNCFEHSFLLGKAMYRPAKLKELLKLIVISGLVFKISIDWHQIVRNFIQKYEDQDFQKDIEEMLEILSKKNRFFLCKKYQSKYKENEWFSQFSDVKDPINQIVVTKQRTDNLHLDDLSLDIPSAKTYKQIEENVKKILNPILPYVEKIQIIDPYFDLLEDRHYNVLDLICKISTNNCLNNNKTVHIIINSSIKINSLKDDSTEEKIENNLKTWQEKIDILKRKHKHTEIEAKIWQEYYSDRFHDRYLITDICSFSNAKGIEVDSNSEATWAILDDNDASKITAKFERNSKHILKHSIPKKIDEQPSRYKVKDIAKKYGLTIDELEEIVNKSTIVPKPVIKMGLTISKRQLERIGKIL